MTLLRSTPYSGIGTPHTKWANHSFSRRDAIRGGVAVLVAAITFAAPFRSVAGEEVPLAIKGYDPVAYFMDGKPTPGVPAFEYEWDNHVWRFSSAEHRELFKSDPTHYAPQFGNYCAMALSMGQLVIADPNNWLISNGKLYIFGKPAPAGPVLFQSHLAENIGKAEHNRPLLPKQ
jgi:YHS domain-containing protein